MLNSDNYIEHFKKFCSENSCTSCKYRNANPNGRKSSNWDCKSKFYDDNISEICKNDDLLYQEEQSEEIKCNLEYINKKLDIIMNFLGLKYEED